VPRRAIKGGGDAISAAPIMFPYSGYLERKRVETSTNCRGSVVWQTVEYFPDEYFELYRRR